MVCIVRDIPRASCPCCMWCMRHIARTRPRKRDAKGRLPCQPNCSFDTPAVRCARQASWRAYSDSMPRTYTPLQHRQHTLFPARAPILLSFHVLSVVFPCFPCFPSLSLQADGDYVSLHHPVFRLTARLLAVITAHPRCNTDAVISAITSTDSTGLAPAPASALARVLRSIKHRSYDVPVSLAGEASGRVVKGLHWAAEAVEWPLQVHSAHTPGRGGCGRDASHRACPMNADHHIIACTFYLNANDSMCG